MTQEQIEDKIFEMCRNNLTPEKTIEMLIGLSGAAIMAYNSKSARFDYKRVRFELTITDLK